MLVAWLIVPAVVLAAPGVPDVDGQDAETLFDRGEYGRAAGKFAANYRAMTEPQRGGPVGQRTIARAYDAYREAWHVARDPAPLREGKALLEEHVMLVKQAGSGHAAREAQAKLEWLSHLLELEEQAATEVVPPPECPEPLPPISEPPPRDPPDELPVQDPPDEQPRARRDPLGLALTTGGSVVLGGGVGLLIGGTQVLPTARRQVEAAGRDPDNPVPQDVTYLAQHRTRGRRWMISGGVVAGVGVAALTWGIVRLVQHRHNGSAKSDKLTIGVSPRAILLRARF